MPTSWPTNVLSEYDADKAVRVGRARALRDRSEVLVQTPFTFRIPSPAAGAIDRRVEIFSFWLNRTIHVTVNARITGGDGTSAGRARLALRTVAGADLVIGPWVTFTDVSAPGVVLDLTVSVTSAVSPHVFNFGHSHTVGTILRAESEKTAGPGTAQLLTGGVTAWVSD